MSEDVNKFRHLNEFERTPEESLPSSSDDFGPRSTSRTALRFCGLSQPKWFIGIELKLWHISLDGGFAGDRGRRLYGPSNLARYAFAAFGTRFGVGRAATPNKIVNAGSSDANAEFLREYHGNVFVGAASATEFFDEFLVGLQTRARRFVRQLLYNRFHLVIH